MSVSQHIAQAATSPSGSIPAYCLHRSLVSHPLSPAQIVKCVQVGWRAPTTGAATLGAHVGNSPALAILIAVVLIALTARWAAGRINGSAEA